jgi:hypothetical protein
LDLPVEVDQLQFVGAAGGVVGAADRVAELTEKFEVRGRHEVPFSRGERPRGTRRYGRTRILLGAPNLSPRRPDAARRSGRQVSFPVTLTCPLRLPELARAAPGLLEDALPLRDRIRLVGGALARHVGCDEPSRDLEDRHPPAVRRREQRVHRDGRRRTSTAAEALDVSGIHVESALRVLGRVSERERALAQGTRGLLDGLQEVLDEFTAHVVPEHVRGVAPGLDAAEDHARPVRPHVGACVERAIYLVGDAAERCGLLLQHGGERRRALEHRRVLEAAEDPELVDHRAPVAVAWRPERGDWGGSVTGRALGTRTNLGWVVATFP